MINFATYFYNIPFAILEMPKESKNIPVKLREALF